MVLCDQNKDLTEEASLNVTALKQSQLRCASELLASNEL